MISMLGIGLVLMGVIGAISSYFYASQRDAVKQRLNKVATSVSAPKASGNKWRWATNPKRGKKLAMIGYSASYAETVFMLMRLTLMLIGGSVWMVSQQLEMNAAGFAQGIAIAISVGIAVDKVLDWRVAIVRQEIARITPDALDLMVVCVNSGLPLEETFRTVGGEMESISRALSREWLLTATEMSVLDSPYQALDNLDERLFLPEVNNMVVTMSQALKFGTPMSEALKLIASDSRQYHLLELEEWVGKIPSKMSFPLVVFIMLPVVVIIVAPIVLSLFDTLGQL